MAAKKTTTINEESSKFLMDIRKIYDKPGTKSVLSSVISVIIGLAIGFIVMLFIAAFSEYNSISDAFEGLGILISGPFASGTNSLKQVGNTIFYAVPLIFTGLSVAIAQKTGLFNIGAAGQFLMGTTGCLLVALNINTVGSRGAGILVWILAVLVGTILAAIWGMIPGLFKALFGVNEVIICIMTNWMAANITSWVFKGQTSIINNASGKSGYLIKTLETGNFTPTLGLDKLFGDASGNSYIDIGIVIAIIIAIVLQIVMNKTTFGFQLKACGSNKNAAKYAGMDEKRNIILSMAIAGALAGLGACFYYLNPGIEFKFSSAYQTLPSYGFNGIPAALLASNNMIGVIVSALFIRHLSSGGSLLMGLRFNQYIADMIIAIIIYLAGFSKLFRDILTRKKTKDKINKLERDARLTDKPKLEAKGGKQ